MRIRRITVQNFRGIQKLEWAIPDESVLCLIGKGDSTKSTILEAIKRVFHPQWNLAFDDSDFFACQPKNAIRIEAVIGVLPKEFVPLEPYGKKSQGWNAKTRTLESDPGEELEPVLCIRLDVTDQLEPSWRVVKGAEDDGVPFRVADRARVHATLVAASADRDLTWSRGSLLSRLTKGDSIPGSLADAARAARSALDSQRAQALVQFDEVAKKAEVAAKELGVRVASTYKADLDSDGINIRLGGLALHDGAIPLRQLGLGSKRMLATGLHKAGVETPHVTLLDEVEFGLEPHRIARVLKHIRNDDTGQYFITTHSPVVLRELTVKDLHVVHSKDGQTTVVSAEQPGLADSIQGRIRSKAEAFLAPRIVVCEGCTEVGFLRAVDTFWFNQGKNSFAYQGVALYDAQGSSNIASIARDLLALSYELSIVADSDDQTNFSDALADKLRKQGVDVISWAENTCLETRVFADVPWSAVLASIEVAAEFKERGGLVQQVKAKFGNPLDSDPKTWTESRELRAAIGVAANEYDWFKRTDKGEKWGEVIAPLLLKDALKKSDLVRKMNELRDWIDRS